MTAPNTPRTRLWREPFLHFMLLGAGLFVLFRLVAGGDAGAERRVVVDEGTVEHLVETFELTWQRPPTPDELTALVDERVREEILAREAMALGLADDDTVVRRRLRQKMELLAESASRVEPAPGELEAWFAEHVEDYRIPARLSLRQVFVSVERREADAADDARRLLAELRDGRVADPVAAGDSVMLPYALRDEPLTEVERVFGRDFAAAVASVPAGAWTGPVGSGYGLHVVFVDERIDSRLPALEEVRDAALRDWQAGQVRAAREAFYQAVRAGYDVETAALR